ncbi:MAG: RagB/SusD family nutrient uptake outer membrane protein [Paludibacteraceae bacterium]|nr:RagB/SusD family nutrient uptake outer membrane protein [Paludibacteraceae bacterium]
MKKIISTLVYLLLITNITAQDNLLIFRNNNSFKTYPLKDLESITNNLDSIIINYIDPYDSSIHSIAEEISLIDSIIFTSNTFENPYFIEEQIQVIYSNNIFGEDKSYRNRIACGYQGMNTDIEYCNKIDALNISRYNCSLAEPAISYLSGKDPWGALNKAIYQCNYVIENILSYSDTTKVEFKYLLGEVYTLRSFVYLEMIKFWGDVPAVFALSEDPYPLKADRNLIYEQIRVDLKKAAELMDWSENITWKPAKNTISRPNKAFALGLLARADLMYAGYALRPDTWITGGGATYCVQYNIQDANKRKDLYQEVLMACGEIIAHYGDTKLKPTFEGVFKDICQDKTTFTETEWLWAMPFEDGLRGQFMNYNCPKSSDALKALVNNSAGSTNSAQLIVPTFIYDFEAGDTRKWVTVAPFTWAANNAEVIASDVAKRKLIFPGAFLTDNPAEKILYQKNVDITKIYLGKYRVEWMNRVRNGNDDGIDYPVMRYADILLMFAEASLGGISGDVPTNNTVLNPQVQFNKVRARAGLSGKTLTMDNIIAERAFEFCGEYLRKYDLERWGKLKDKLVATTARLNDLDNHQGEFAGMTDTVYFKYRNADELVYTGIGAVVTKGYVVQEYYGFTLGENTEPADYATNPDIWVVKNMYGDFVPRNLANDYKLYENVDLIDKRHYYPIFQINIDASNGSLWNDYDY